MPDRSQHYEHNQLSSNRGLVFVSRSHSVRARQSLHFAGCGVHAMSHSDREAISPSIVLQAMVDVAKQVGADAVAHGCTGKGNDQVRFELTFFSLDPKLQVVAPWREWDIRGREDAIEYAKKHNVPVPVTKKSIYSRDRNVWHISHEVSTALMQATV